MIQTMVVPLWTKSSVFLSKKEQIVKKIYNFNKKKLINILCYFRI